MSFTQRLGQLSRDAKLTQRDLALRLDVDRRTHQRYELGQIFPFPETLVALVTILGLRFEVLFTLAPPMPLDLPVRRAVPDFENDREERA